MPFGRALETNPSPEYGLRTVDKAAHERRIYIPYRLLPPCVLKSEELCHRGLTL